jgi:hypothetical protein
MSLRKPDPMMRLLLSLWSFGEVGVKRAEVMKRTRMGQERVADYAPIVDGLVADGSISIKKISPIDRKHTLKQ